MDKNDIIHNKPQLITSKEVYNKIYTEQFLEIIKLTFSFVLARLLLKLFEISIAHYFRNNKIIIAIFIIIFVVFFTLILLETFTYLKIKNDKDAYLKELTRV